MEVGNYSARFSFGSEGDATNLIMSMDSDWTFVMGSNCKECPSRPYRFNESSTYRKGPHDKSEIIIGERKSTLTLKGFTAQDSICLGENGPSSNESLCMSADYEFFVINELSLTDVFFDEIVGGELGLGIDIPDNGPSVISMLKQAGAIDEEIVAVHIDTGNQSNNESRRSRVTIGSYEPQFV